MRATRDGGMNGDMTSLAMSGLGSMDPKALTVRQTTSIHLAQPMTRIAFPAVQLITHPFHVQ